MSQAPGSETRAWILAAARRCVERWSVSKTTIADIASEAGVSRATLYRTFAGRDELIAALVDHEMAVFFGDLARHVDDSPDLESLLTDGLMFARSAVAGHSLYQRVMGTEPELLLPMLMVASTRVRAMIADYLRPWVIDAGVPEGDALAELLDYLARMVLSYIEAEGGWDMADRSAVGRLVRSRFIAAVEEAATPTHP